MKRAFLRSRRVERHSDVTLPHGLILLVLALAASGCANLYGPGEVAELTGQSEANRIVWLDGLDRHDFAPVVAWVRGAQLDCTFPGGAKGFHLVGLGCLTGYTPDQGDGLTISVAIEPWQTVADTQIAHEMVHAALLRDTGNQDKGHRGVAWQRGELVEQLEARLLEVP